MRLQDDLQENVMNREDSTVNRSIWGNAVGRFRQGIESIKDRLRGFMDRIVGDEQELGGIPESPGEEAWENILTLKGVERRLQSAIDSQTGEPAVGNSSKKILTLEDMEERVRSAIDSQNVSVPSDGESGKYQIKEDSLSTWQAWCRQSLLRRIDLAIREESRQANYFNMSNSSYENYKLYYLEERAIIRTFAKYEKKLGKHFSPEEIKDIRAKFEERLETMRELREEGIEFQVEKINKLRDLEQEFGVPSVKSMRFFDDLEIHLKAEKAAQRLQKRNEAEISSTMPARPDPATEGPAETPRDTSQEQEDRQSTLAEFSGQAR